MSMFVLEIEFDCDIIDDWFSVLECCELVKVLPDSTFAVTSRLASISANRWLVSVCTCYIYQVIDDTHNDHT